MVIFYKKWKKYNEIQLTKNKMDLNIRKMKNHPHSPERYKKGHKLGYSYNAQTQTHIYKKNLFIYLNFIFFKYK